MKFVALVVLFFASLFLFRADAASAADVPPAPPAVTASIPQLALAGDCANGVCGIRARIAATTGGGVRIVGHAVARVRERAGNLFARRPLRRLFGCRGCG